jgi:hypothetical protein
VSAARRAGPALAAVAAAWLVAAVTAARVDGYDAAPGWLLVLDQVVLVPVLVGSVWWAGATIGGRLLGALAALAVVAVPPLGVAYALAAYDETYAEVVLPRLVGIGEGGGFAAAALLALAAALLLRSLRIERALPWEALAAGAAAGAAALADRSAVLFLAGAALALAAGLAARQGAAFAAGAAAPLALLLVRDGAGWLDVSRAAWSENMAQVREYLWSNRVLQWLPVAGTIGAARGSLPAACLLGGWLGAFGLAQGASPGLDVADGSLLLAFQPALPAFALALACLPLLVPTLPERLERLAARLP